MTTLTENQTRVLSFIGSHIAEHGYAPSHREMTAALGWSSTSTVVDHLRALEKKGFISRPARIARAIKINPI